MASFLTINVNGLRDHNKRLSFLQWLSHLAVDFVCLQETHVSSCFECDSWFSSYGFLTVSSPGSTRSCGSVILYRSTFSLSKVAFDSEGRFIMAHFSQNDVTFGVACVYAPNRNPERNDFFAYCADQIDPVVPTVLCGDFNAVFDRSLDRRGVNLFDTSRESSLTLGDLFRDCCVIDIWRSLHPTTAAFTWLKPDGTSSSRIDLVGCPHSWLHRVDSCQILSCPFSDHSAVVLKVSIPEPIPRGPGRWKLNSSVLADADFVASIKSFWLAWKLKKNSFDSLLSWWDRGKERIKGLAIKYCKEKSQRQNMSRSVLIALADHLKSKIDQGHVSFLPIYQNVSSKIAALDLSAAQGAKVRSRVKWAEEGETSSRYFLKLERKRGTLDWISAMKNSDGSIVSDLDSICKSWTDFYSSLFSADDIDSDVQADLLSHLSSSLSVEQASDCEGYLTVSEVHAALNGMARGKSPGSDGLPMEFYTTFWDILGPDLVEVLNASLDLGCLSSSQRVALISLIYKKGDRLLHKNWRPISLLNVDYKLCARALAGRLLKVLQHVIHPDQTCGVRGRYIGENVALLRDVVHYVNDNNLPAAILALDQEKAFDRVDWNFLLSTLNHMGFGPSFISWVKLLYSNIRSAILINGYTSNPFWPSRGVRQGCPLSPLLYVISIEVLAANLRSHPSIVGLRLRGIPDPLPVLSLYADDTSVISTSDDATRAVFSTYERFEKGTGSKLNLSKCEGLWLGAWRNRSDSPVPIAWSSVKIKVLGVFLGNGLMDDSNWLPRIEAVEKCLNSWRSRTLSYGGKAIVSNALALSRVWYIASLVPMPPWALSELNSLVFKFFWSGKRDLVARNVVFHSHENGGFSVVSTDFKVQSLLVQWIKRFASSPSGWVGLMTFWFTFFFNASPLEVFSDPFNFDPDVLPPFYAALLKAWRALGGSGSPSGLVVASSMTRPIPVESITCKLCYQLLLSLNPCRPHCVVKFRQAFPNLDWLSTWQSLFFLPLDRQVIDLNWKIAHGVLYTAERLCSFGYDIPKACFCGFHLESSDHLFFSCPLAQSGIAWIQSLLFLASPLAPPIELRHMLFGFSSDEFRCVPKVFAYLLNVCKFLVWSQRNDFRFRSERPSALKLLACLKSRTRFYLPLFFKRFISSRRRRFFNRQWGANGVIGIVSGEVFDLRL